MGRIHIHVNKSSVIHFITYYIINDVIYLVSKNHIYIWVVQKTHFFFSTFLLNNPMEDSTAGPSRNNTENSFTSSTRVVRVHWLKFLFYSWKRISILSKFVISCYILLVILQVKMHIYSTSHAQGLFCLI